MPLLVIALSAAGASPATAEMRSKRLDRHLCKTVHGGRFVPIPGFPGEQIDRRLLPDIRWMKRHYDIFITDGYSLDPVHSQNGEHPLGLATDIVPNRAVGGTWGDGPYFDFSYEHLVSSAEASLRALRTDYLDILLLHRPDALVEPEEVARAFDELESSGKVRAFGVSNQTPGQIELLKSTVKQPLLSTRCSSASRMPISSPRALRPTWTGSASRFRAISGCSTTRVSRA